MKSYIFWIQSSRGTEQIQHVRLPDYLDKSGIKYELEHWCSRFGAWHVSENAIAYGWVKNGVRIRNKIHRHYKAKAERSKLIGHLIAKKITPEKFNQWTRKNKKALAFPFK